MFDMTERNKRLDDFGEYLESHELTVDDMLAVICSRQIRLSGGKYTETLKTSLMVGGKCFKVEIYEVSK